MYIVKVGLKISARRASAVSLRLNCPIAALHLSYLSAVFQKKGTSRDERERRERNTEEETANMKEGDGSVFLFSFSVTARSVSPKSDIPSHPKGPQDLRSNGKSCGAHGPDCSSATLTQIPPNFHDETRRLNMLFQMKRPDSCFFHR